VKNNFCKRNICFNRALEIKKQKKILTSERIGNKANSIAIGGLCLFAVQIFLTFFLFFKQTQYSNALHGYSTKQAKILNDEKFIDLVNKACIGNDFSVSEISFPRFFNERYFDFTEILKWDENKKSQCFNSIEWLKNFIQLSVSNQTKNCDVTIVDLKIRQFQMNCSSNLLPY
jgi:hypothetical protein